MAKDEASRGICSSPSDDEIILIRVDPCQRNLWKEVEMNIRKVGVLGCGLMGSGIAQVAGACLREESALAL
jgi:hypothetical protein